MIKQSVKLAASGIKNGTSYRMHRLFNMHQYPRFAVFQLTDACNSRCIMCSIWKKPKQKELTAGQIGKMFSSKLFRKLRWINLTGGEPFLRSDFAQVVMELAKLPSLEGIAVPSNGFLTDRIMKNAELALKALGPKRFLSVTLSIDGFEKTHEKIRGVKGGFGKVMRTLDELQKLKKKYPNFNVGVQPTISKINLDEIEKFYRFMKTKTRSIGFAVMMTSKGYYDNVESKAALDEQDKRKVGEFLLRVAKEDPQYGYYYSGLSKLFETGRRKFTCLGGHVTVFISPKGEMYPCPALSFNNAFCFGNAAECIDAKGNGTYSAGADAAYTHFFSAKAADIKKRLKVCGMCKSCPMMCDFINVAKVEFFEHLGFLARNPKTSYRLAKKIVEEKSPYF
jgi:MoaA/NifB/PqqE/SkfB family radical SAM enzyme